jgi:hypothetical protein
VEALTATSASLAAPLPAARARSVLQTSPVEPRLAWSVKQVAAAAAQPARSPVDARLKVANRLSRAQLPTMFAALAQRAATLMTTVDVARLVK